MIVQPNFKLFWFFFILFGCVWKENYANPKRNIRDIESSDNNTDIVNNKTFIGITESTVISDVTESDNENSIITEENEYRAKYAKKMLSYMNLSVNPCDDFYEYSCGNWGKVIKEHQAQHKRNNLLDIIYELNDAVDKVLKKSPDTLELDYGEELKLAQQFYQNCLTAKLFPMQRSQEYLDVIKLIGGFPALDASWSEVNFSWFNMSAHLTNYGAEGLLREEILPTFPFPPYFKLPELGFDYIAHSDNIATNESRGYELNTKRMHEYLTTYGVDESRISDIISNIFKFWRAALIVIERFNEDSVLCEQMQADILKGQKFEKWKDYYEIAWMGKDFNLSDTLGPCDLFFIQLDDVCEKHKEAVANYLAMKFLYHMDARLKEEKFQEEYCLLEVQKTAPYLIDQLYLNDYFNDNIRLEIVTIMQEIRKSLRNILQEADWLDETTREEALLKESTLVSRIGSFEDPMLIERLIRSMNNLTFIEDNFERNNINLKKFKKFMRRFNGLHYEELSNDTKPLELLLGMQVNAFYYNVDNSINVMAGILHPPAYHKAWPYSLKFGTIGYLVGHELTHGFDSVGANFDSTGDERYWWSKKSGNVFNERANCYVDHYNSYVIPEINRNINGNLTLDENIADSGGLLEALSAYRRFIKELSKESKISTTLKEEELPGLDLTPDQLFFLGFAQLWCAAYEEEHYWEELTDEHTVDKYRVLGAVTNLEDFAKAYNCSLGSKMHQKAEKCKLW